MTNVIYSTNLARTAGASGVAAAVAALILSLAPPAAADSPGVVLYDFDGAFEDAAFGVESAILDRGLVVDHVSHVGDMLNRTKADVGGAKDLFEKANVYMFCSATLSRKVMEADPMNIAHCPYGVFVMDSDGAVQVGYRSMPEGPMKEVETLLDAIAREAVE